MNKLDAAISNVAYILDNLILLRNIQSTGDCNVCKNKECIYKPEAGQMVRYNCPFYKAESEVVKEYEIVNLGNGLFEKRYKTESEERYDR